MVDLRFPIDFLGICLELRTDKHPFEVGLIFPSCGLVPALEVLVSSVDYG